MHRLIAGLVVLLLWACAPVTGVYHPVKKGQTLFRISRTYGVDERYLARINGISDPTRLLAGTRIFVPGADRVLTVPAAPSSKAPSRSPGLAPSLTKKAPAKTKAAPVVKSPPPEVQTNIKFNYPLKGKIVKTFGQKSGEINRGIEISAPKGTPIHSAAAGKVIYSGAGIRSYGNLIILRHEDSFYTVYGYNQTNLVQPGSYVGKGQKIALCGVPPGGGEARLHFEIRQGKKAVDPIFYLP